MKSFEGLKEGDKLRSLREIRGVRKVGEVVTVNSLSKNNVVLGYRNENGGYSTSTEPESFELVEVEVNYEIY